MPIYGIKQRLGVILEIEEFLQYRFPDWRLSVIYLSILALLPLRLSRSSLKSNLEEINKFIAYYKFPLGRHFFEH